jgi:hypothetical protein
MGYTSFIKPSNINKFSYRENYLDVAKEYIKEGDIYQFGVFSGISMISILDGYKKLNKTYGKFWGFDSFCGIPKETNEDLPKIEWGEGEFSTLDYLNLKDPNQASQVIYNTIKEVHPESNIEMVVGYFSESLKSCPLEKMKPASYIDIDVDIYSSTIQALEFLCQNNLIVSGTVINFDDWIGYEAGEGRALLEISQKYKLDLKTLIESDQRLFVCKSIK